MEFHLDQIVPFEYKESLIHSMKLLGEINTYGESTRQLDNRYIRGSARETIL